MARKRSSWWGTFDALTKSALRVTRKSIKHPLVRAAKKATRVAARDATGKGVAQITRATRQALTGVVSPAKAIPAVVGGQWQEGRWGAGPLALRKYRLFVPEGITAARPAPMLILLHGCGQDSGSIAASTRVAALARQQRFIALLPEQSSQANPQRCWNWFRTEPQVGLEATIIKAIIDHVCRRHPVDTDHLYAIGISAGGTMALTLGLQFPTLLRAVGAHSSAAPHSAANTMQAGQAMRGRLQPDTAAVRQLLGGHRPPPLVVFHGERDYVVSPENAIATVALWLEAHPDAPLRGLPNPLPATTLQRGARRRAWVNEWPEVGQPRRKRAPYVRLIRIEGLAHAWSGGAASQAFSDPSGPDALKLAWKFFSSHA